MEEVALFVLGIAGVFAGSLFLLGKFGKDVECPCCGRRPRSMERPDGLCRICRDPELYYMWAATF